MFVSSLVNLGVITGHNGLVVLDFDDRDTFFTWWGEYQLKTYMVLTARGVHVYILSDQPAAGRKGKGIDVKARGGYVLAPPSIHPTRAPYEVLWNEPIARVPSIDPLLPAELFPVEPVPGPVTPLVGPVSVVPDVDPWAAAMNAGDLAGRDLIGDIRKSVSILDYINGARPSSADGRWYMAPCPFHDDNHPSFWIDTRRQVCGCHAGCEGGRPMDVINLVARLKGLDNRAAIFYLAKVL